MGNNTYAPVLGRGTAIIELGGHKILVRDVLHVPALRTPLYSLRAHHRQYGCGVVGNYDLGGMFVYFPRFSLRVDTSTDSHLGYRTVGGVAGPRDLDYVQPKVAPSTLYSTRPRSRAAT